MPTRYFIRLPDPAYARGDDAELAFAANGPEAFAAELQAALRNDDLYQSWQARQPKVERDATETDRAELAQDQIDELAAVDPAATVSAELDDFAIDLHVVTRLPAAVLKHRLAILAGRHWQLRDVQAA